MVALGSFTIVPPYTVALHELYLLLLLWDTHLGKTAWTRCIWGWSCWCWSNSSWPKTYLLTFCMTLAAVSTSALASDIMLALI